MSTPHITNLYALLGLTPQAKHSDIAAAIVQHRQHNTLKTVVLDKAEAWLLQPEIRGRYDAQLQQAYPELFAPSNDSASWQLEADPTPVRLGLLDGEQLSRHEVRIEPESPLESIVYVREHQRYNMWSKMVIYGLMAAFFLGMVLLFAWPWLKSTVFAPSDWDKHEFRQHMVQQGWQEDPQLQYVYLQAQEYDSQLILTYQDNELMPALTNTTCDMDKKGMCDISVRLDNERLSSDEKVGVGLLDYMPLASRGKRDNMVERLQDAHQIEVSYQSGGETITQTFKRP